MDISDNNKQATGTAGIPHGPARIQLFCPIAPLPVNLQPLMARKDIQCSWILGFELAEPPELFDRSDMMILYPGKKLDVEQKRKLGKLLFHFKQKNIPTLLLSEDQTMDNLVPIEKDYPLYRYQRTGPTIGAEELWGRICSMLDFSPMFDRVELQIGQLQDWASALNNRFEALHQELQLAWRVQQDFLPKQLPKSDRLNFAAMYRPASWVSGDIYDIFQLDEKHVGFFIADVVGHGVAAGLMTLFVKRALVTKEIADRSYRLLTPGEALGRLNDDLCSLELPEHQFVTACYGIINIDTHEITLARAGHPFPLVLQPDRTTEPVNVTGALLGIFPGTDFPTGTIHLQPGSKLFLYTDGLEQVFDDNGGEKALIEQVAKLVNLPAEQIINTLSGTVDCQETSLHPVDDITAIIVESIRPQPV